MKKKIRKERRTYDSNRYDSLPLLLWFLSFDISQLALIPVNSIFLYSERGTVILEVVGKLR